jgi:hypothetical protein
MVAQNSIPMVEYDMRENGWIDHRPHGESADALWRACVVDVAARAAQTLPSCAGRVDLAHKLVLDGHVTFQPDGSAYVKSQSAKGDDVTYHVNGACECPDFPRAPEGWCKHRLARAIAQRARTALALRLQQQPPVQETTAMAETPQTPERPQAPQTPQSPAAPLYEAPVSSNVYVMVDGRRVQVTVRGHTWRGVLTELRQVLADCPDAAADAPPGEARAQTPAGPPPCPEHGNEKLTRSKFKGWYCKGKLSDGSWCKYEIKDN